MKQVIRIPEDEMVSVETAYEQLPIERIKVDRNGRRRQERTKLMSCSGRHVICRDIGYTRLDMCWDPKPVDKIVITDFERRIYLRRHRKSSLGKEI